MKQEKKNTQEKFDDVAPAGDKDIKKTDSESVVAIKKPDEPVEKDQISADGEGKKAGPKPIK